MSAPAAADTVLVLDVRDLTPIIADGDDGPVLLLTDADTGLTHVELGAGMARPGDADLTAALARIGREWLRFAALLQTVTPTRTQPSQEES